MIFLPMGIWTGAPIRPNVSKWVRSESNGFLHAWEEWLINLELPLKLFICSDVLGKLTLRAEATFPRYELNVAKVNFGGHESFRWLFRLIQNC